MESYKREFSTLNTVTKDDIDTWKHEFEMNKNYIRAKIRWSLLCFS